MPVPAPCLDDDLDQFVDAFEAAHRRDVRPDLGDFLPSPTDPLYLPVLRELVCVDLDYGWGRGDPTPLEDYRRRFPALFADAEAARAVVWEDYRQRRLAGQEPDAEDYRRRFGVSPLADRDGAADADGPRTEAVAVPPSPLWGEGPGVRGLNSSENSDPSPPTPLPRGERGEDDGPPTQVVCPEAVVAPPMAGASGSGNGWADRLDAVGTGAKAGAADLYREARRSDPAAAERYAKAMAALPAVGDVFASFRLEGELGRGAFGRVFLARQTDLADRPVALKVSVELFAEAQTLARLQHTNIVPVYSQHQVGPVQAVCMPYFGGTTLADVFKALTGKELPASGKHFVSTLHGRKNSTVRSASSADSAGRRRQPSGDDSASATYPAAAGPSPAADAAAPTTEALAALERYSYPEAVLWLGARLAAGLAHAHGRGVVHRDLKPANVLLTDDGEPMLLDFNLADNAALRGTEAAARVGGTLPYMSPEQLRAFQRTGDRRLDGRSDIYSLGLILFELLTGRTAFPASSSARGAAGLAKLLEERSGPPPRLRSVNPAVTPAVEAIVRRCLEPDPARRYQSARELQEDIERHLRHLPLKHTREPSARERLRKWARRHPRLTSGTSVAAVAAVALVAAGIGGWALYGEVQRRRAVDGLREFDAAYDQVRPRLVRTVDGDRPAAAIAAARVALAAYDVFDRPDWQTRPRVSYLPPAEQDRLRGRVGEVLFLMTQAALDAQADGPDQARDALWYNDLAAACFPGDDRPRAWWEQRAALLARLGDREAAVRAADEAKRLGLRTTADRYLAALRLYEGGRPGEALPLLIRVTADDPKHFWAWLLRGNCHHDRDEGDDAARCYTVCISLDPAIARPYADRAQVLNRRKDYAQAVNDADRVVQLDPAYTEGWIESALARYRLALALASLDRLRTARDQLFARAGDGLPTDQRALLRQAEERLTHVLGRPDVPTRAFLYRADVRRILGDKAGAAADLKEGLTREPAADDDRSWVARGVRRQAQDPKAALADFRRAEQINPRSFLALQDQAHVLTEFLNRPQDALAVLDRLIALYPEFPPARAGRAVVLARLGRAKDALADAEWVKAHTADPLMTYQVAGVYARTGDTREALRLLSSALTRGVGFDHLARDPELEPIRDRPEFRQLTEAVRTLQSFLKPAAPAPPAAGRPN